MAESDPRINRASGLAQGAAPVRATEHAALRAAPEDLPADWQEPHEHGPEEPSPDVAGDTGHDAGDPLVMEARQRIVGLRPAEALGRDAEVPRPRPEERPELRVEPPLQGNADPDRRPGEPRRSRSRLTLLAALLAVLAIGGGAAWYLQSGGGTAPSEAPAPVAAEEATEEPERPLVASDTLTASPAPTDAAQPVRRVDEPAPAEAADPIGGSPATAGASPEPLQPNRVRTVAVEPAPAGAPVQPERGTSAGAQAAPDSATPQARLVPLRVRTTTIDGTGLPPAIEPEPLARAPQPLPASPSPAAQAFAPAAAPAAAPASAPSPAAAGTPAPAPPLEARLPKPRPVF